MRRNLWWILLAIFTVLDYFSTLVLIAEFGNQIERNPVARLLFENFGSGVLAVYKFGLTAIAMLALKFGAIAPNGTWYREGRYALGLIYLVCGFVLLLHGLWWIGIARDMLN